MIPASTRASKSGTHVDVLVRQEILAGHAHMAHRPHPAPGLDDARDPRIVGLDVFARARDPVMVKVENERHLVGKRQEVVETEADLVVLERDQVPRRLGQVREPLRMPSAPTAFAPPWMLTCAPCGCQPPPKPMRAMISA